MLAHIAPLGWQHVNLTGDYLWAAEPQIGPDGFRPLRTTAGRAPGRPSQFALCSA
jgi:hypothetical protein